jgi:hypothetical protein
MLLATHALGIVLTAVFLTQADHRDIENSDRQFRNGRLLAAVGIFGAGCRAA